MPESTHDLLLAVAGRVDDDLLAWARELVAIGEDGRAVDLLTATLIADRVALPAAARAALVDAGRLSRAGLDADRALPPAAADVCGHRFGGESPGADVAGRLATALPAERLRGCRVLLAWRLTPAGSAPGPLPQPVLLVESDGSTGLREVLTYQVAAALERARTPVAVEVFDAGAPLPAYHAAALDVARPLALGRVVDGGRAEHALPRDGGVLDDTALRRALDERGGRRAAPDTPAAPQPPGPRTPARSDATDGPSSTGRTGAHRPPAGAPESTGGAATERSGAHASPADAPHRAGDLADPAAAQAESTTPEDGRASDAPAEGAGRADSVDRSDRTDRAAPGRRADRPDRTDHAAPHRPAAGDDRAIHAERAHHAAPDRANHTAPEPATRAAADRADPAAPERATHAAPDRRAGRADHAAPHRPAAGAEPADPDTPDRVADHVAPVRRADHPDRTDQTAPQRPAARGSDRAAPDSAPGVRRRAEPPAAPGQHPRPPLGRPVVDGGDPLSGPLREPLLEPLLDPTIRPEDPLGLGTAPLAPAGAAEDDDWFSGSWALPGDRPATDPAGAPASASEGPSPRRRRAAEPADPAAQATPPAGAPAAGTADPGTAAPDTAGPTAPPARTPAPPSPRPTRRNRYRPDDQAAPPDRPEPPQYPGPRPETLAALSDTERELLAQLQAELAARERRPRVSRRAGIAGSPSSNGNSNGNGNGNGRTGGSTPPTPRPDTDG